MAKPRFSIPTITIEGFSVNIPDLPDFAGFGQEFETQFQSRMKKIGYEAKEFWKSEAGRRLTRSRDAYQKSITVSVKADGTVNISLGGQGGNSSKRDKWLAKAIESGAPAYDLKPGFLKGGLQHRVIPLDTKTDGKIFRTVKATGHENKWIHPGFKSMNLMDYIVEEINNNIIPKHVNIAFTEALKKFK